MDLKRVDRMFRVLPKEERYYAYFDQLVATVVEGCEYLCRFLGESADPVATVAQLKGAERRGDDLTREIMVQLNKSFVTPIDREDIFALATALDDILDDAYGAASFAEATGFSRPDEHLSGLADLLLHCARELHAAIEHLNDRDGIGEHSATVHRLESEADERYVASLRALYAGSPDPVRVVRLTDLYGRIEKAIDRCEDAANILDGIVLKNR
jgi:predicted phosphate transport protein (TIGR00153 family)